MNLERLRELLASGAITQDEFDNMSKDMTVETTVEPATEPAVEEPNEDLDETIEKLFQSKRFQSTLDKALAQERKEKAQMKKANAELEKKVKLLERQKMTDEEARQLEFEEQQKELEEQRRELTLEKNKMYAVKALKKAEIGDTEESLALMERLVVSCADETDIDDLVTILKDWHDKSVKAEVDKRFKANGYTPKKAENLNNGVNPYLKEQWNYTAQNDLEYNNPELAAQLKAAAGVK